MENQKSINPSGMFLEASEHICGMADKLNEIIKNGGDTPLCGLILLVDKSTSTPGEQAMTAATAIVNPRKDTERDIYRLASCLSELMRKNAAVNSLVTLAVAGILDDAFIRPTNERD